MNRAKDHRGKQAAGDGFTPEPDDLWMQGFAAALGTVQRCHRHDTVVRDALISNGLSLRQLIERGVGEYDAETILGAIKGCSPADKQARGASVVGIMRLIHGAEE